MAGKHTPQQNHLLGALSGEGRTAYFRISN
jgi:hypothetical protein